MNVLKYGMEGYDVRLLQYALRRAGEEPGNPDGIFGRRTLKALQAFQREKGLSPDGVAGKLSWAALFPYLTGYALHRVRPGETLPRLAHVFGADVEAIRTANPAMDPMAPPMGETAIIPLPIPVVGEGIPSSGLLTGLQIQGLTRRYPCIRAAEIGRSVMGQRIVALSMGKGLRQVGYSGAHGADQWIAVPLLLRFLEEYAQAYVRGSRIGGVPARALFEAATLHMVPLVNPDGVDLVTGALDPSDSFYAQAQALCAHYPSVPFPEGWQSNISGVDLSLQYPANWEQARRYRYAQGYTRPGPKNYVGSGALTAPESRALANWTREHDFSLTLSCRVPGGVVYASGGPSSKVKAMGAALCRSGGCVLMSPPNGSALAGYADWFGKAWNRPGFTLAAGPGAKAPSLDAFETVYAENLPIFVQGLAVSP